MGKISTYGKNAMLDHMFNLAYTPAATIYLALSTTDTASSTTEPSGNGYARTAVAFSAPVSASRKIVQDGAVTFPEASGAWGTISHWAIFDASTGGNQLAYGAFTSSFAVVAGNTPTVPTTEIEVSIDATTTGAGYTNTCVDHMLNLVFRNTSWTQPTIHVAVALATLSDSSTTLTEEDGSGYARVAVTAWDDTSSGNVDNTNDITIGPPSADDWDELTSLAIMSASSGGELLAYDNDNVVNQTPTSADTITIVAGSADFTLN